MTGYRCVVIGGGVHGTHIAVQLLSRTDITEDEIRIIESRGKPLAGFEEKCEKCGMNELRSPFVHHIGVDPFGLRDFARSNDRTDELVPSETGGDRPTLALFLDHADRVVDRYDIDSLVVPARATDVCRATDRPGPLVVETTRGPLRTRECVLAVGHGGAHNQPAWSEALPEDAPVTHVWDEAFSPGTTENGDICVVGGGITAAQLTTTLARPERTIRMLSRSPLRVEQIEADQRWMHPGGAAESLRSSHPGSKARYETIDTARHDGTLPPYTFRRLRRSIERERVELHVTDVEAATWACGPVVVNSMDGRAWCFDRIVLATGFHNPYSNPLLDRIATSLDLEVGFRGMPVLDDDTLAWRGTDGRSSRVFVTGVAAESVLGAFGRNIIGARRAGDILTARYRS